MKWATRALWLLPVALAAVFWWLPPRGDDAYYHSVGAVEQVRAWQEGAVFPGYHRGWNGGTGSFAPTVYAPIPTAIQGGLAWLVGDGQRAVGLSLALAVMTAAALLFLTTGRSESVLLVATPYVLAAALTRATTTEAWALAGAAAVLALGMPGAKITIRRGFGLAAAVVLVAGSQIGMLVQLSWVLGAAWVAARLAFSSRHRPVLEQVGLGDGLQKLMWAAAGVLAAAVFWLPTILERRNLALGELVTGPFDWRRNFLPGDSELSLFFSMVAVFLGVVVFVVFLRGEGGDRLAPATAAAVALVLTVGISAPLWFLPGMKVLQFPWRFLGPATVLAVIAVGSLRNRWRWLAATLLVVPSALVPLRLDSAAGHVRVGSTPEDMAWSIQEHWGLAPVLPSARGLYAPGFHRLASLQELGGQAPGVEPGSRTVKGGEWRVTAANAGPVLIPLQWWPDWRVTVDDREVPFANHHGLVAIDVPGRTSTVRATLLPSKSRSFGCVLSLFGVLVMVALARFSGRSQHSGESP